LILFTDTDHNTCKTSFPFFRVYYTIVSDGGALTEVLHFIPTTISTIGVIDYIVISTSAIYNHRGGVQTRVDCFTQPLLDFSVGRSMDQNSEELKCLIKSSLGTKYSNGVIFFTAIEVGMASKDVAILIFILLKVIFFSEHKIKL